MWIYEKKLQYPIQVDSADPKTAKLLFEAYGGQDGELSMALQYLNQRYTMMDERVIALLTDIGTEELAHAEIIAALIFQLTKDATPQELEDAGLAPSFASHGKSLFYQNAAGVPWSAQYIQATGDPIADLSSNIATEERARVLYQHLLNLIDDPGIKDTLSFLRERAIVHSVRFREALELLREETD
ncbi:manganese catalase family protein [Rossellomorea vietnamensis]|uniref:Manganese catalase family protein n=1 Tax=Rossellomorea vietnamensis TaxID=218284 RepID=A0A5D4M6R9_9BACI|nr:manganese catalase family protein [Rossellomorea vietnamensis]TYR97402.1 manganese catalase family protein [Rossellomorea vietnamensis]